jgi:hypothetical protein
VLKVLTSFKFNPEVFGSFKQLASKGGVSVTGAFERFMSTCVEEGVLVFPERNTAGFEAEARVLVDWLRKGKHFYRTEDGVEVNISGRLVWLLSKVRDSGLLVEMEDVLKGAVSRQS